MKKTSPRNPVIVGIAGGSASGKTWLADYLLRALGKRAVLISQDWYYRDQSAITGAAARELNFDHPRAFETMLMMKHLRELREHRGVQSPVYDYANHSRLDATTPVSPADLILVEGLFVLHETALRRLLDVSVFVDVPADIRLMRRLRRDAGERGIPVEETLRLYERFVRPMHERFVQPSGRHATHIWRPLTDRAFPARIRRNLKEMLS